MGGLIVSRGIARRHRWVLPRTMTMGVSLRDSPSGRCAFHVFLPARQFEEVRVRFTLEQVAFARHRLQLCLDPTHDMAAPYRMAPNYECKQTLLVILEFLLIHDAEL